MDYASRLNRLLTWSGSHGRPSGWQNTRSLSCHAPGGAAILALRWALRCSHSRVAVPGRSLFFPQGSIRGGYVCRSHGGATRQARRLAAYRLWRAGIWESGLAGTQPGGSARWTSAGGRPAGRPGRGAGRPARRPDPAGAVPADQRARTAHPGRAQPGARRPAGRLDAGSACLPHGCGHGGRDDPGRAFRRAPQAPPEALAGQARTGQARPGRAAPQPDQVSRPEAAAVRPPRSRRARPPSSSGNSSAGASVNSSPPWGGPHGRRQASRNGPASANPAPCASPQAVRVPAGTGHNLTKRGGVPASPQPTCPGWCRHGRPARSDRVALPRRLDPLVPVGRAALRDRPGAAPAPVARRAVPLLPGPRHPPGRGKGKTTAATWGAERC